MHAEHCGFVPTKHVGLQTLGLLIVSWHHWGNGPKELALGCQHRVLLSVKCASPPTFVTPDSRHGHPIIEHTRIFLEVAGSSEQKLAKSLNEEGSSHRTYLEKFGFIGLSSVQLFQLRRYLIINNALDLALAAAETSKVFYLFSIFTFGFGLELGLPTSALAELTNSVHLAQVALTILIYILEIPSPFISLLSAGRRYEISALVYYITLVDLGFSILFAQSLLPMIFIVVCLALLGLDISLTGPGSLMGL